MLRARRDTRHARAFIIYLFLSRSLSARLNSPIPAFHSPAALPPFFANLPAGSHLPCIPDVFLTLLLTRISGRRYRAATRNAHASTARVSVCISVCVRARVCVLNAHYSTVGRLSLGRSEFPPFGTYDGTFARLINATPTI